MMIYETCTQTDPGLIRKNNEDAVAVDPSSGLCVLADGMGGYNAGEIASNMAMAGIRSETSRWLSQPGRNACSNEVKRAMENCVQNANRSIFNAANSNPRYTGMGTTLVVGMFRAARLMLGHIGNSRCHRLRGDAFEQITKGHPVQQEQIDAGHATPEQALHSANKNLFTRALGVEKAVLLDVKEHQVDAGDAYVICSDGLSDMVRDSAVADILHGHAALEQKCRQLIKAANLGLRGGIMSYSKVRTSGDRDAHMFLITKWDAHAQPGSNQDLFTSPTLDQLGSVAQSKYTTAYNAFLSMTSSAKFPWQKTLRHYCAGTISGREVMRPNESNHDIIYAFPMRLWNWIYGNATRDMNGVAEQLYTPLKVAPPMLSARWHQMMNSLLKRLGI